MTGCLRQRRLQDGELARLQAAAVEQLECQALLQGELAQLNAQVMPELSACCGTCTRERTAAWVRLRCGQMQEPVTRGHTVLHLRSKQHLLTKIEHTRLCKLLFGSLCVPHASTAPEHSEMSLSWVHPC